MKQFLQQNPLIAFSIALPLVVIALFAAATLLPRLFVDPPAYDFLIVDRNRASLEERPIELEFALDRGELVATVHHLEIPRNGRLSRLYRFDHRTSALREIPVLLPENVSQLPSGSRLTVEEFAELRIDPALTAPDGYEFLGPGDSSGLMMEFFGANRARSSVTIARDGARTRVRLPGSGRWHNDVRFLGWVVD